MTRPVRIGWIPFVATLVTTGALSAQPAAETERDDVTQALKKAARFYREKVASHGGYVYYYTPDLKERWGEGKASPDTIFVQPPGTPTVGEAYLRAYEATKDPYYLDAARETAEALVYGQLQSGGWTQVIHFAKPEKGRLGKYRNGKGGGWNVSSLDDGQTQSALKFLMRADEALGFNNQDVHDAAVYGLAKLLQAQYPNGAFPQGWLAPAAAKPVAPASFPPFDWKTEGKIKEYWSCYTLNDNLAGTVADTLIEAYRVYKDKKYRDAVAKLGDFLILAQMPDPQPGWCQQYNFETVPIWARKFEPPAITGWESQDVMETLCRIARFTGEKKYLEPVPRALVYFRKSLLSDGRIARFYEFRTNKALYMDAKYQFTYDDAAVPGHYGWKQPARFDAIEADYRAAKDDLASGRIGDRPPPALQRDAGAAVRAAKALDADGRWVTTHAGEYLVGQPKFATGFRFVSSEVFARNVEAMSEFLGRK